MIHSITFGTKNSRADWGLALMTQPTFAMPPLREKLLESPGMNGVIDLSTAITGYPVFGNRTGSFEFVRKGLQPDWQTLISEIAGELHGQYMRIVLDDDPGWYYEGRVTLDIGACERQYGTIVVNYSVGPFKWSAIATNEPWLWDPFSFVDGVIGNGSFAASFSASASVTTTAQELAYTAQQTGIAFFFPEFTVTGDHDVVLVIKAGDETRDTITLEHGETASVPRLALTEGRWLYRLEPVQVYVSTASGTATLAIAASVSYQGADVYSHIAVGTTAVPLAYTAQETGEAPLQPQFVVTGENNVSLYISYGGAVTMATLTHGQSTTVPRLVLYRGGWLYNGLPATLTAATSTGTANLGLVFRIGRL